MEPKQYYYQSLSPQGFHKLAYVEWGESDNPKVLICVHGVSRNSRDFDFLARELQNEYRIICPDVVGRGSSDFTHNPLTYHIPQYVNDMTALFARLNVNEVNWLGTSMGGLIGMTIASMKNTPIKKLILNDVGIRIPLPALQRIVKYASEYPLFKTLQEARENMMIRLSTFGVLNSEIIDHLSRYNFMQDQNGNYVYRYDPEIFKAQPAPSSDLSLMNIWAQVKCPTLLIHGVNSDLLLPEIIKEMVAIRPNIQVVDIPDTAHAPSLMVPDQIQIIRDWLSTH